MVNLHHPSPDPNGVTGSGRRCGVINSGVVQQVLAAKWAIEVINNRSLSNELKIGENKKKGQKYH